MTTNLTELDAHEQPSEHMRAEWKRLSRQEAEAFIDNPSVDDPRAPLHESGFLTAGSLPQAQLAIGFAKLAPECAAFAESDVPIIYHPLLPGLLVFPSLVPPPVQHLLLDRMIHRDLSNPEHQTNLHLHYQIPYPEAQGDASDSRSFFSIDPETPSFIPKDPAVHKPLSIKQVMQRRLHWVTFGGQYDWTNRVYPKETPLEFPSDISDFLETLFPETQAQASILNFYTPGDTMMMHRDVSEETNKGLVSLSLGCDGLFMITPNQMAHAEADGSKQYLLLRLRSGDAIYMTGESRYAWHGVPKVLKGTCPAYLKDWPSQNDGKFADWRGWMENKRVNLNVRQMRD
ncbi:hypothetical protein EDB81DRAFT_349245 [Dactylonectria macrodidyma]|uniref:mRNA N(6)-methyladenine demethylase n=1 Tax=Dactylonectria macrodidyma TaxID=307937 RepID=A0A9P9FHI0_9HYPO|nr:hypothetical protein EDB81DRAFT_349245 [Dactylonectria macrodidyma]